MNWEKFAIEIYCPSYLSFELALDLAYLSLNGYAKFDIEEMNLELLYKAKLKKYLKKNGYRKLYNLILKYKQNIF